MHDYAVLSCWMSCSISTIPDNPVGTNAHHHVQLDMLDYYMPCYV